MSEASLVRNLGIPVEADAETIENELRAFWETASSAGSGSGVVRACSCNMLVLAHSSLEAAEVLPVLAQVSQWHPHRSLVVWTVGGESRPHESEMRAWIGVQCSLGEAGSAQVCSESVSIEAPRRMLRALPANLSALLVPDLPVFLYWRSFRESDRDLAEGLARFADVLVVDSHASKDDPAGRKRLLEALVHAHGDRAVRDLNWERLTPWRELLSQFFDAPAARHYAREISAVDITRSIAAKGKIPTRTLLLTGWLASRLGWHLRRAVRSRDRWESVWDSQRGDVAVCFSGAPEGPGMPPGINSICIETSSGASFRVAREPGTGTIAAYAEGTVAPLRHCVPDAAQDEAVLIARELSLAGPDSGFHAALGAALELERRFLESEGHFEHE